MGAVKRHLYQGEVPAEPEMYAGTRSIEHSESMHHHERNVRLEYDGPEFLAMCRAMASALESWSEIGRPAPSADAPTSWLDLSELSRAPSVTPTRFEIEESEYETLPATTIHLHYRNLRIEFSHAEWEAFAAGVSEALERWRG